MKNRIGRHNPIKICCRAAKIPFYGYGTYGWCLVDDNPKQSCNICECDGDGGGDGCECAMCACLCAVEAAEERERERESD